MIRSKPFINDVADPKPKLDHCPGCGQCRVYFDGLFWRDLNHGNMAINYCGDCGFKLPYPTSNGKGWYEFLDNG